MTPQDSLFGDASEPSSEPVPTERATSSIPDWQVDQVRSAFDSRGVTGMSERQHFIESVIKRPVTNVRELTSAEARKVVERLSDNSTRRATTSWDDREEDTWIDRL